MANMILRLSTGSAATTNSNPSLSLGGAMATNPEAIITTSNTTLNNLWDDITKAENYSGSTEYRCVYVHNDTANPGEIFAEGEVFLSGTTYANIQLGVGTKNTSAPIIANEKTAPVGISFSSPTTSAALKLMNSNNILNPGDYISLWIKRVANNISGSGTVTDNIQVSLRGAE